MLRFKVGGMSCGHCVQAVTKAVKAVDGQASVDVDLARGEVAVDSSADAARIARAIEAAGYEVRRPGA